MIFQSLSVPKQPHHNCKRSPEPEKTSSAESNGPRYQDCQTVNDTSVDVFLLPTKLLWIPQMINLACLKLNALSTSTQELFQRILVLALLVQQRRPYVVISCAILAFTVLCSTAALFFLVQRSYGRRRTIILTSYAIANALGPYCGPAWGPRWLRAW